jgi:hypothetical protein
LAGSPAIDVGNNAQAPATDQRGAPFLRIFNGGIDIGAYERQTFTFFVDTPADENDGNYGAGDLSLREAVAVANSNPGHDAIRFAESLASGIGGVGDVPLTLGELLLTGDLTITGLGATRLSISGNGSSRVFHVASGAVVELAELAIRNGRAADGGGLFNAGTLTITNCTVAANTATNFGGGVHNAGELTLADTTVSGNSVNNETTGAGGGISNTGELVLRNSTVSGNNATRFGGGIFNGAAGVLTLVASSIASNTASGFVAGIRGGGIYNLGSVTIVESAVWNNAASPEGSSGGGIYNQSGSLTITNSTISGNSANQTGGIFNNAQLIIKHSTVTANSTNMFVGPPAEGSGGIAKSAAGVVTIQNTIVGEHCRHGGGNARFLRHGHEHWRQPHWQYYRQQRLDYQ